MNPWDTRYDTDEFYYGTEPNDFLKASASLIAPGGEVLCLAEGKGHFGKSAVVQIVGRKIDV
jgi:hypothetical protein